MTEAPGREVLPQRRQNTSIPLEFMGQRFTITIGYYPDGRPAEVFCSGNKASDFEHFLADVCVVISRALQARIPVDDLGESLGKVPVLRGGAFVDGPASPVGLILEQMTPRPQLARLGEMAGK